MPVWLFITTHGDRERGDLLYGPNSADTVEAVRHSLLLEGSAADNGLKFFFHVIPKEIVRVSQVDKCYVIFDRLRLHGSVS